MKTCKLKKICKLSVYSRDLCKKHYEEARRHGDFDDEVLNLDYKIYPFGWVDKHRPKWHKVVRF